MKLRGLEDPDACSRKVGTDKSGPKKVQLECRQVEVYKLMWGLFIPLVFLMFVHLQVYSSFI